MRISFLILVSYALVNAHQYRYRYAALSKICGGRWTNIFSLLIPIFYATVAFVQNRAGCEHLWAEWYTDTLPTANWWVIKDFFSLLIVILMSILFYRVAKVVVRAVCGYWRTGAWAWG